jgi:hypothetical protein
MRVTIILFFLFLISVPVKADLCFRSFEKDTSLANIIFVGKLYKISEDPFWHRGDPLTVFNFEIYESFKGLYKSRKFISIIGPAYGCCNVKFKADSTYLVFAYEDGKNSRTYWTNDCSNTQLLSESEENYKRLGVPLIHPPHSWSELYVKQLLAEEDSVKQSILLIKSQNNVYEEQNKVLKYILVILVLIVVVLTVAMFRHK